MYKLVAIDLDGTLLKSEKKVSDESKKYLKNVFVDSISVFRPWTFRCMKEGSIRIHCPFILLYWEHGLEPDSGPQGNAGIWKFA